MTYGGVLEYFTQDEVAALFAHVGARMAPSMIVLTEPLADDFEEASETRIDHRWVMMVARTPGRG